MEYTRERIDDALRTAVRHTDRASKAVGFHGTHVAGIAAGDGINSVGLLAGAAPRAWIVVVATRAPLEGRPGMGEASGTIAAVEYILGVAEATGLPVVINQSQGDNFGPHDGTGTLERRIDELITGPGRIMVKSAGNEAAKGTDASGVLAAGATQSVTFQVPAGVTSPLTLDIWYPQGDEFDLQVVTPTGQAGPVVPPGVDSEDLEGVFTSSELDDPDNHDGNIRVVISPVGETLVKGTWTIVLIGRAVASGRWDAWLSRDLDVAFDQPWRDPARSLSVPATAHNVISVGSYVTRGESVGGISSFSSLGPTRDGRAAPTLTAPGELLAAPQPALSGRSYGIMAGTSMAAPVVAGVVALMLAKNPRLTAAEVRAILAATARVDEHTGPTPVATTWGSGKLDARAALAKVPPFVPAQVAVVA